MVNPNFTMGWYKSPNLLLLLGKQSTTKFYHSTIGLLPKTMGTFLPWSNGEKLSIA
jgi:hypothetical protein